jgi:hypothetical protein
MQTEYVVDELRQRCQPFQAPGWDGYQALPVSSSSIDRAVQFVESLSHELEAPAVGAEPDGQVTLEWYRGPRQVLSVSVSPDGDLHYAALVGRNRHYGTIAPGEPIDTLVGLARRVTKP